MILTTTHIKIYQDLVCSPAGCVNARYLDPEKWQVPYIEDPILEPLLL